ncbi:hypothetical protein GCM10023323_68270 [Streptomyces thinghirensis]|uniref:Uncharacterized protein n=1 Tax=Streptomyces thinghirensis TaxID=551547 RepID=A0ABP9TCK0_9ACTN
MDAHLWHRSTDTPPEERKATSLYNASTVVTVGIGVLVCYVGLMVINLVWASFILNDQVFSSLTRTSLHATEYWTLSWFVASIATVGGALGTGLDQSAASTSRLMPPRPGRQVAPKSWAGRSRHSTHCG